MNDPTITIDPVDLADPLSGIRTRAMMACDLLDLEPDLAVTLLSRAHREALAYTKSQAKNEPEPSTDT